MRRAGGRARGVGRATKWYGFLPPPSHYFFQLFFGGVDGRGGERYGGKWRRKRERVKRLTRMGTDRFFFLGGGGEWMWLCWLCGGVVVVARVDDEKWRVPVCYCISIYTHSGSCWFRGGVEGSVSEDASVPVSLKFGWRPGRLKVFFL